MKKILWFLLAALLSLSSCSNDEQVESQNSSGLTSFSTLNATMSDSDAITRAYITIYPGITEAGEAKGITTVYWDQYDEIGVFSDTQLDHVTNFNIQDTPEGKTATFVGDETVSGNMFYAFYPRNIIMGDANMNPAELNVQFDPQISVGGENVDHAGYHFGAPMVAHGRSNNMSFLQTTAMIHISLTSAIDIYQVEFKGKDEELLAGPGYIDLTSDQPVLRIYDEDETHWPSRIVSCQFATEGAGPYKDAYFIIPPTYFRDGFTLILYYFDPETGGSYTISKDYNNAFNARRASVYNFTAIDLVDEIQRVEKEKLAAEAQLQEDLLTFFYALGGDKWMNEYGDQLEGWDRSSSPFENTWTGLEFIDRKLTAIRLSGWNLSANVGIPDVIGNFTDLMELDLSNNQILGAIPESFSNLVNLQTVDMSNNGLTRLPTRMDKLVNLYSLHLENNEIEDMAPLFTLPKLDYLYMSGNKITTTVTTAQQETAMWNNLVLALLHPQKNGYKITVEGAITSADPIWPEHICIPGYMYGVQLGVKNVQPEGVHDKGFYWIVNNKMWAHHYANFITLRDAEKGVIHGFAIDDDGAGDEVIGISKDWGGFEIHHYVEGAQSPGETDPKFKMWMALGQFKDDLGAIYGESWTRQDNWFVDMAPDRLPFADWYGIITNNEGWPIGFDLHDNGLIGNLPENLATLFPDLETLDVSSNNIGGTLPDFTGMDKLRLLNVSNNYIMGPLPESLFTLPSLEELILTGNQFDDTIDGSLLKNGWEINPQQDGYGITVTGE